MTTSNTIHVDISKLSLKSVEQLTERCEHLIHSHKAVLEDYELYIECQAELAKRGADTRRHYAGSLSPHFINS